MGDTSISWTDKTWNPGQGCSRVSEGCRNCYAERLAARFAESGWSKGLINLKTGKWNGTVRLAPHKLAEPLSWRKPCRVFVNSMTDLFHDGYTNEEIAAVFGVMYLAEQHTHQVLTKRIARARSWFAWLLKRAEDLGVSVFTVIVDALLSNLRDARDVALVKRASRTNLGHWPLPNVWLGVSVENQEAADERIPELLATPAAIRFLSCEPLLEHLTLAGENDDSWLSRLDWVIAGCESGPGARVCDVAWLRSLRDQCGGAGVAYFLKQAVEPTPHDQPAGLLAGIRHFPPTTTGRDGSKRKGGGVIELPYLDGVQHAAFPEVR